MREGLCFREREPSRRVEQSDGFEEIGLMIIEALDETPFLSVGHIS
jgi:hypothetical protein